MIARATTTLAALVTVTVLATPHEASAQTVAEARTFFADFDQHTLFRTGQDVVAVYATGAGNTLTMADRNFLGQDIFDRASTWAGRQINADMYTAWGRAVPANVTAGINASWATVIARDANRGNTHTLDRLSNLQLRVMRRHFPNGANIDMVKLKNAFLWFANGELRPQDMNQLYQYAVWYNFADACIRQNISAADWTEIMKLIVASLEIYPMVYPPGGPVISPLDQLLRSAQNRYVAANARTAVQLTAHWNTVANMNAGQLRTRYSTLIRGLTQDPVTFVGAAPGLFDRPAFAVNAPMTTHVLAFHTDDTGAPIAGDAVTAFIYRDGSLLQITDAEVADGQIDIDLVAAGVLSSYPSPLDPELDVLLTTANGDQQLQVFNQQDIKVIDIDPEPTTDTGPGPKPLP